MMETAARELAHVLRSQQTTLDEFGLVALAGEEDLGEAKKVFFTDGDGGSKLGVDLGSGAALYRAARTLYETGNKEEESTQDMAKVVLLLSADYETVWNVRKMYLGKRNNVEELLDEIRFTDLVLSKHYKSAPTWVHRHWALQQILGQHLNKEQGHDEGEDNIGSKRQSLDDRNRDERTKENRLQRDTILQHELEICQRVAASYYRCYNAWSYRAEILGYFDAHNSMEDRKALHHERLRLRSWFVRHVSDHSAMNQMLCVLRALGNPPDALEAEITLASRLAVRYPGHEALWRYKRGLVYSLLQRCSEESAPIHIVAHLCSGPLASLELDLSLVDSMAEADLNIELTQSNHDPWADSGDCARFAQILQDELTLALVCASDHTCARSEEQRRCALGYVMHVLRSSFRVSGRAIPSYLATWLRRLPHARAGPLNPANDSLLAAWAEAVSASLEHIAQLS
ncbi:Protein prenyltransferase alpha subunit repeat-containing protein 1 [Hondaea fermentalgiana]|uniref:Protein prenyltransferase alpha subunit repeat-containing protein 1 n=1 Tax=Hondaea fermentalgiana TaxID=2315210 RepID=A0A2R5G2E7_9STRA|nr:Protein prenyltransferase alpha subunit repeat-containing protein 1 [Hondaea fermentalgiana]|eukprot:GBG23898.1 Protein prenyltransferase alpha subunit repeat-containing protein 1 [Hondaea fermentalgiana]